MDTLRLSARPPAARGALPRRPQDVIRRFFHLIERMERTRHPAIAPEVKARISRLDESARRHG